MATTEPFLQDPDVTLYHGDVLDVLRELPDESVDCVITSPPYWGLRDYGTGSWEGGDEDCDHLGPPFRTKAKLNENWGAGFSDVKNAEDREPMRDVCGKCGARRIDNQLGLENTPDLYVARMVEVFREVRRVLAKHGTCWVNMGSSYFSEPTKGGSGPGGKNEARWNYGRANRRDASGDTQPSQPRPDAPAYGSGDTERADSRDLDPACRDLCDGCLDDFLSHRARTTGTPQPLSRVAPPASLTSRDTAPADSEQAPADVVLLDAPVSTTLESWRRLRGECSRCSSRASALSDVRSSASDAPASARNSWLNYTRRLKPKDLVPTPWMLAMALQEDGWYLRADICWSKSNPMPESVTDRPTKAHEYVFLLSKQPRYFFDQEAVREPSLRAGDIPGGNNGRGVGEFGVAPHAPFNGPVPSARNIRSVWEIATQPYPEAHFATYPEELVRRCLLAGCPEWVCGVCGKPRERIVEVESSWRSRAEHGAVRGNLAPEGLVGAGTQRAVHGAGVSHDLDPRRREVLGWSDCGCLLPEPGVACSSGSESRWRAGVVLDPFMGSGTTALVARNHGRHSIGIELNETYLELAARRLQQLSLLAEPA